MEAISTNHQKRAVAFTVEEGQRVILCALLENRTPPRHRMIYIEELAIEAKQRAVL